MADEKKEPWLNLLALTTVIFAVCATLATFKGGGYSTRSVMRQSQASNKWEYYQAKSIKGYQCEMSKDKLELDLKALGDKAPKTLVSDFKAKIEDYGKNIARYEIEKKEIMADARKLEGERDEAGTHSQAFGLAVIFLQISILLSSIAALLKQKPVYYLGLAVGIWGAFSFANGFFLFKFWPFL